MAEQTWGNYTFFDDYENYSYFFNHTDLSTFNQSLPFLDFFDYDYFDIGQRAKRILSEPDKVN